MSAWLGHRETARARARASPPPSPRARHPPAFLLRVTAKDVLVRAWGARDDALAPRAPPASDREATRSESRLTRRT